MAFFSDGLDEFERQELIRLRAILIAGALLVPVWGVLFNFLYPNGSDPLWMRAIVGVLLLSLASATWRFPNNIQTRDVIGVLAGSIIAIHGFYIVALNHWMVHHTVGNFIAALVTYPLLNRLGAAIVFSFVFMACSILAGLPPHELSPPFMAEILWSSTCVSVGMLANLVKYHLVRRLIRSEEMNRTVLRNLHDGVVVHDSSGQIVYANPAAPRILGLTLAQMEGKTNHDPQWKTFDEDGAVITSDRHPSAVAQATGQSVLNFPITVEKPDGAKTNILVSASPIFSGTKSAPVATIVTFADVTEAREAQKQVQEQQAMLVNASRLSEIGEVASGISHEINNPLSILSMRLGQMRFLSQEGKLTPDLLEKNIEALEKTVDRIARIVRGVRSLARVKHDEVMEVRRVRELVDDSLELVNELFLKHNIELKVLVPEDLKAMCRAGLVTNVIFNLVQNSIHAVTPLEERWIKIHAEEERGLLRISVEDSGKGIAKEILGRIMQPFFTTKPFGKGTGIGLSIASRIAQEHGGRLYYDERSINTRFVLELPLAIENTQQLA